MNLLATFTLAAAVLFSGEGVDRDLAKNPLPANVYDVIVLNHVYDNRDRYVFSQILAYQEIDVYEGRTVVGADGDPNGSYQYLRSRRELHCFRQVEVDREHLIFKNPNGSYSTFVPNSFYLTMTTWIRMSLELRSSNKVVLHSQYNLYYQPNKIVKHYINHGD